MQVARYTSSKLESSTAVLSQILGTDADTKHNDIETEIIENTALLVFWSLLFAAFRLLLIHVDSFIFLRTLSL